MYWTVVLWIVVLAGFGLSLQLFLNEAGRPGEPPAPLEALRQARRALELSGQQRHMLACSLALQRNDVSSLAAGNAVFCDALAEVMVAPGVGRESLNDLYAAKRGLAERAYVLARDRFLAFHAVLTPVQRQRLAGLVRQGRGAGLVRQAPLP
ncbi:hypothetical protein [Desulfovibrio sp. TomC]|uniref:hypothetical protein n=1 Tax=Desulfovibrio sp. TomC TaxID=1562888 RepID=UPI0005732BB3|nr:hypothetical protein [Desulfovibrio sp. TomC]KHK01034.1 hypothetical protein NY78_3575 [Desulfovibrio sp. TomC]